jgi:thiamine kinase-like enzyme
MFRMAVGHRDDVDPGAAAEAVVAQCEQALDGADPAVMAIPDSPGGHRPTRRSLARVVHNSRMDPRPLVERLWPGQTASFQPLQGGITNHNFRVDVDGDRFVLRIGGAHTELLGIDRRAEAAAARMAADIGVGPEVVAVLEPEGCLVTRFIEGEPVALVRMREPELIRRVAGAVRVLHGGPGIPSRFDSHEVVRRYARTAAARGVRPPPDYEWALGVANRIRAARGAFQHAVPCHNDLLNANFLQDHGGERIWIVDWEYAGMGDPYFDLGNFSVKHDFGEEEDRALVEAYTGARRNEDVGAVRIMRFMGAFFEAMWGVVQQAISQLDFDYAGYAAENFDRLRAIAGDPTFERWLAAAPAARSDP